jgi:hypothetical protein
MLLHYYKHETGPEHKAIIAVDALLLQNFGAITAWRLIIFRLTAL